MQSRVLTVQDHSRKLEENRYVYAVLSRRSSGISIGINLNPDKVCNLDCIYCQVDRNSPARTRKVDLGILEQELKDILHKAKSGSLYSDPPFAGVPEQQRVIKDIAFSGDGEPTTYPRFKAAIEVAIRTKEAAGFESLKIVLISNATMFHRAAVKEALAIMDRSNGEIWAKLDAGTEPYYNKVDVTTIPFERVLENIMEASRLRPLVIQSLFMRIQGAPPDPEEVEAYCRRLAEIVKQGGRIRLVHVYTVARPPAQSYVTSLSNAEVDAIAEKVRLIPLPVAAFYSTVE